MVVNSRGSNKAQHLADKKDGGRASGKIKVHMNLQNSQVLISNQNDQVIINMGSANPQPS